MSKRAFASLFVAFFVLGAGLRLARLGLRPMHHDEANQALKFGQLLEQGEYRYDPLDHHGPSLYYLSLPFALVLSGKSLPGLDETTLRLVTASFGLGTILLLLLFVPMMGRAAVAWSALALAVSPVMTYFSRFYIQETLLVFFLAGLIASVWRYALRPGWGWAAAAGFCAGLMYATKETSIIAFGAAAAGLLLVRPWGRRRDGRALSHGLLAVGSAAGAAFLLFSSFLQNPGGLADSLMSFRVYFARAGEAGFHVQPWYYYFGKLAWVPGNGGPAWSEGLVLGLALAGAFAAFAPGRSSLKNTAFARFLVVYSALAAAVYSAIPYKTPWNILPFYLGFILLAGVGTAALAGFPRRNVVRLGLALVLAAGFLELASQSRRASFVYPADPRNPYAYAQTSPDYLKLVRRVEDLAALAPDGRNMLVKVIAGPYETWPLPWSLRRFGRVGYWPDASSAGDVGRPPVVIASAGEAAALEPVLGADYQPELYALRPETFLTLFIRGDLWGAFLKTRER